MIDKILFYILIAILSYRCVYVFFDLKRAERKLSESLRLGVIEMREAIDKVNKEKDKVK